MSKVTFSGLMESADIESAQALADLVNALQRQWLERNECIASSGSKDGLWASRDAVKKWRQGKSFPSGRPALLRSIREVLQCSEEELIEAELNYRREVCQTGQAKQWVTQPTSASGMGAGR